jgi:hypothetical protein
MLVAAPVFALSVVFTALVIAPMHATLKAFREDGPLMGVVVFFLSTWFCWLALWAYMEMN